MSHNMLHSFFKVQTKTKISRLITRSPNQRSQIQFILYQSISMQRHCLILNLQVWNNHKNITNFVVFTSEFTAPRFVLRGMGSLWLISRAVQTSTRSEGTKRPALIRKSMVLGSVAHLPSTIPRGTYCPIGI